MKAMTVAALIVCPLTVQGETWETLAGDAIRAALSARRLQYETAWQRFHASGRTLYHAGAESWGYWRIKGDQYCSQWPPSDLWTCYGVARAGQGVRFIGPAGGITEGTYAD